jgi:hypothetical protein
MSLNFIVETIPSGGNRALIVDSRFFSITDLQPFPGPPVNDALRVHPEHAPVANAQRAFLACEKGRYRKLFLACGAALQRLLGPSVVDPGQRGKLRPAVWFWNKMGQTGGRRASKLLKPWWPGTELNRRRQPFQGCALPTELPGRVRCFLDSSGRAK